VSPPSHRCEKSDGGSTAIADPALGPLLDGRLTDLKGNLVWCEQRRRSHDVRLLRSSGDACLRATLLLGVLNAGAVTHDHWGDDVLVASVTDVVSLESALRW
jgi:hypothetical protein